MGRKSVWIKAEFSFCSPLFIPLFSTYCPHVFLIFLHFFFHIVWIIFIKYQYKKYRNIFFYVFSLYFYLLMFYQCGTVFQTAFLTFLVIPRLRPGLLSLRSVLSSRQLLLCFFAFGSLLCVLAFGSLAMFKIYHG